MVIERFERTVVFEVENTLRQVTESAESVLIRSLEGFGRDTHLHDFPFTKRDESDSRSGTRPFHGAEKAMASRAIISGNLHHGNARLIAFAVPSDNNDHKTPGKKTTCPSSMNLA